MNGDLVLGIDLAGEETDKTVRRMVLVVDDSRFHLVRHHVALMRALAVVDVVDIEVVNAGSRGLHVDGVIIDDPHADLHTYEGEYHEVQPRLAMSSYSQEIQEVKALANAQSTEKNKGPQARTKYPRRR